PRHRSPRELHQPPAHRGAERRSRRSPRQRHHALSSGKAEGRDGRLVTIHRRVAAGRQRLRTAGIPPGESDLDARLLAQHVLGWSTEQFLADAQSAEPEGFGARFDAVVERRATREPLAYIVGVREFWGLDFEVTRAVLIPRPATELIVEAILDRFPDRHAEL